MSYRCSKCGHGSDSQLARCPACQSRNTLVRVRDKQTRIAASVSPVTPADQAKLPARLVTGMEEYDRVLGGGAVYGFVQLWGAEPGAGKSTLMTQLCGLVARQGKKALYVCGEEDKEQLNLRVERLGVGHRLLLATDDIEVEAIRLAIAEYAPAFVVVDSIQSVYCHDIDGDVGGLRQIYESARRLQKAAQLHKCAVALIGHVDKDGLIAGGRKWQHLVDGIFMLQGSLEQPYRFLRGLKNRQGSTQEVGVLEHTEQGLLPVQDLTSVFAEHRDGPIEGAITTLIPLGNRYVPVEIQALVVPAEGDKGKRFVTGFERTRLEVILATLRHKTQGLPAMSHWDVYLSVVGDVPIESKSADLAVALAVMGSALHKQTSHLCALGEIALSGEIAQGGNLPQRRKDAERRGLQCVMPQTGAHLSDVLQTALEMK